jgi:hypothetical protein
MKSVTTVLILVAVFGVFAAAAEAQTITITNPTPAWTRGQQIVSAFVTTVNGIPNPLTTYAVASGTPPTGITIGTLGTITGTPTAAGPFTFSVTATVPLAGSATQTFTMTINSPPSFTTSVLTDGRVNQAYSATVGLMNGTPPYGYVVWSGSLPPGLALNALSGAITGTPTTKGDYAFTVRATDLALAIVDQPHSIRVRDVLSLAATGTKSWTVNRAGFDLRVEASDGDGSYTFDTPTGVPAGLDVATDATGVSITGTPTTTQTTTVSVKVTDGTGATATLDTVVTINPPPRIATDSLPDATLGAAYRAVVAAADGAGGYTFRVVSTTASWLGIDAGSGTFTGTPTAAGTFGVQVEATDSSGATAKKNLTFEVVAAPTLAATPLPIGVVGRNYAAPLGPVGGSAPLTGSLVSGRLPDGLAISGTAITGTPTAADDETFTVRITDRWGATAEAALRLTVGRKVPVNGKLAGSTIDPEGREAIVFDLLRGSEFSVNLKVKAGTANFTVTFASIAGVEVDTTPWRKVGKRSVKLRKVPIVASGRYALIFGNASDLAGLAWSGRTKGKPAKKLTDARTFGPLTGDVEIGFSALKDARLAIQAKVGGKDAPAAEFVELLDVLGRPMDAGPYLKSVRGGFKLTKLMTPTAGRYVLRLRPAAAGAADGILKVKVKIRSPKEYTYSLD